MNCRFIPACAGNATWRPAPQPMATVHPRVCGERWENIDRRPLPSGSSPRVRGTRIPSVTLLCLHRFIPACAGNALSAMLATVLRPVHPRVCGERDLPRTLGSFLSGSSPRVRGTHRCSAHTSRNIRFIPACAGNAPANKPAAS